MSSNQLVTLLGDEVVGHIRRDPRGRLTLIYSDSWRFHPEAYPLSLSMPLALAEHGHSKVEAYLWGLLPDNELILETWASRFAVSPRSAFALMTHVGEDCAGAVRLVRPEHLAEETARGGIVEWLDEPAVADRLRALRPMLRHGDS